MQVTRRVLAFLLLSATPAFAQDPLSGPEPAPAGTVEEAQALIEGLVPYVGRSAFQNGALKVEPDPAGLRVTIDPKPLAEALKGTLGAFEMTPSAYVVSRRNDGAFNYFSDSALKITARVAVGDGEQVSEYDIGRIRAKGVYSPELAAPLSAHGLVEDYRTSTRQPGQSGTGHIPSMAVEMSGRPAAAGGVDLSMRQTIGRLDQTIELKQGPQMPIPDISIEMRSGEQNGTIDVLGMRSRPLLDLYGFLLANPNYLAPAPDRAKLAATQGELKSRLAAALPLWNDLKGDYVVSGIELASSFGRATIERLDTDFALTGVAEASSLSYSSGFRGLEIVSPMLPAWAATLLPRELEMRIRVDGLNLRTAAEITLADLDFARTEVISTAAQARIANVFETSPPRFVIESTRIVAADYDLSLSGSVLVRNNRPALTLNISAGGVDKAIATLQNAAQANPDVNQVVGALAMAKGFGKGSSDGRTQWIVDASSDGSVKINGFQIKGPDPVTAPDADDDAADPEDTPANRAPTDDNALPDSAPQ